MSLYLDQYLRLTTWPAVLFVALGIVVTVVAWRGIRRGGSPVCRRCRYNLSGIVGRSAACPECGADLLGRRAVVAANRRRLWIVLAAALVMFAVGATILGERTRRWAKSVDWDDKMPVWVLERTARGTDGARSWAARQALVRRVVGGELDDDVLVRLLDAGVPASEQLAGGQPPPQWLALADWLWDRGSLGPDRQQAHVAACLRPWVTMTPATRATADGPLGVRVSVDFGQFTRGMGAGSFPGHFPSLYERMAMTHRIKIDLAELTIDGQRIAEPHSRGAIVELCGDGGGFVRIDTTPPPGLHDIQATFSCSIGPAFARPPHGPVHGTWSATVQWSLDVVEPGDAHLGFALVADPELASRLGLDALAIDAVYKPIWMNFGVTRAIDRAAGMLIQPIRALQQRDVAVAFEVFAHHGGETALLGWLVASPFEHAGFVWMGEPPWRIWPDATTIDLEFRPSTALMAMLPSAEFLRDNQSKMPVWNAPIIVRDVSIDASEPPPHFAQWWPEE